MSHQANDNHSNNLTATSEATSDGNNEITVIDVIDISEGMMKWTDNPSSDLVVAHRNLSEPVQNIIAKTSVCKFYKRSANDLSDHDIKSKKYTKEAFLYFDVLERTNPRQAKNPLSLIGLRCFYCASNYACCDILADNIKATVAGLCELLYRRTLHIFNCIEARKFLGETINERFSSNYNRKDPKIQSFLQEWILHEQRTYFLSDIMPPVAPPPVHQPPSTPTTGASNVISYLQCQQNENQQQPLGQQSHFNILMAVPHHPQGHNLQISQDSLPYQLVQGPSVAFVTARPPQSQPQTKQRHSQPKPRTEKRRSQPKQRQQKLSQPRIPAPTPEKLIKLLVDIEKIYSDGLEDLCYSMFNDEKESANTKLRPLPPPKPDLDFWVPLQTDQLAQCPRGVPCLKGESKALSSSSSKDQKQNIRFAAKLPRLLKGKIGNFDVVLPSQECNPILVQTLCDLIGNRRFLRLVSELRSEYESLSTEEEKLKLANEKVVDKITEWGGVFRKARCRNLESNTLTILPIQDKNKTEAIHYTIFRFEMGFADIFNGLVKFSPPTVSASPTWKITAGRRACNSPEGQTSHPTNGLSYSKVSTIEHAPNIGLIRGYLKWGNTSVNNPKMKLSDLKRKEQSCSSKPKMQGVVASTPLVAERDHSKPKLTSISASSRMVSDRVLDCAMREYHKVKPEASSNEVVHNVQAPKSPESDVNNAVNPFHDEGNPNEKPPENNCKTSKRVHSESSFNDITETQPNKRPRLAEGYNGSSPPQVSNFGHESC